jgi:hypothetical protein
MDPNNPMMGGSMDHVGDILRHMGTFRDTNYGKVANHLGIDPLKTNPFCDGPWK